MRSEEVQMDFINFLRKCACICILLTFSYKASDSKAIVLVSLSYDKVVLKGTNATFSLVLGMPVFSETSKNIGYQVMAGSSVAQKGDLFLLENTSHLGSEYQDKIMELPFEIEFGNFQDALRQRLALHLIVENEVVKTSYINFVYLHGAVTLIPVAVLLLLAILLRQALVSLAFGLFLSSTFINGFDPLSGFLHFLDHYLRKGLENSSKIKIMLTLFLLCGLIGGMQKGGGAAALTKIIGKFANNRWSVQWAAFIAGLVIFIDDFASILIVGPNIQPLSDLMYLSREKLSFIVHILSSPLSCIVPISSWIGMELGLISGNINETSGLKPFVLFMKSIPRCYFIIVLFVFCGATITFKREFGTMLTAEKRAFGEKKVYKTNEENQVENPLAPNENTPLKWYNAAIPILVVIVVTILALFYTGYKSLEQRMLDGDKVDFTLFDLAGNGDPEGSMLYATFLACLTSFILHRVQGIMDLSESISVFIEGTKDLLEPLFILFMAWGIGESYQDLKCSKYIVEIAKKGLDPSFFPTIIFILGAVISFSTGTSWGTMTVMFPIVIPLVQGLTQDEDILTGSIGSILSGAIFGDLSSPISGTTIMSSLSCKLKLEDHFFSQLPYTITVAIVTLLFAYLPVGFSLYPYYVGIILSCVVMILILFFCGERVDKDKSSSSILSALIMLKNKISLKSQKKQREEDVCVHE